MRAFSILLVLAIVSVLPAASQPTAPETLPALFDVAGVAENDVLNVREAPEAAAESIGELASDQRDIEVVAASQDGAWGRINLRERSGWVAMRYLKRQERTEDGVPDTLSCSGTEPFWSLSAGVKNPSFSLVGEEELSFKALPPLHPMNMPEPNWILRGEDESGASTLTAIIRPLSCSDGMSDRAYGLDATLVIDQGGEDARAFTGCCSLAP